MLHLDFCSLCQTHKLVLKLSYAALEIDLTGHGRQHGGQAVCADDGTRVVSLWGERDTVELEALRSVFQLALMEPHLRMRLPLWPVNFTENIKLNRGNEHVSIL